MLITVRDDKQKIAMGLLSYLPEYKDISVTQREMDWYLAAPNRQLYLWQDDKSHHFMGLVGTEAVFDSLVVHHLIFSVEVASNDRFALRKAMLDALQRQNQAKVIMGNVRNQRLINEWREQQNHE